MRLSPVLSRGEGRTHQNRGMPPATPATTGKDKKPPTERLRKVWPEIRSFVYPRRKLLVIGFILIIIGRVCGLVLPLSTRYLIDDIIGKRHFEMLVPLVLAVLVAMAIQAVCAFSVAQLLSIEGQKVIAELRRKVQE